MPRADWNLISNSVFMVSILKEEQSKIGEYFNNLDHLITLHQREHIRAEYILKYIRITLIIRKEREKMPEIEKIIEERLTCTRPISP